MITRIGLFLFHKLVHTLQLSFLFSLVLFIAAAYGTEVKTWITLNIANDLPPRSTLEGALGTGFH
jgi:hypothetical protein